MNLKQINPNLAVADQVSAEDVGMLADAGFKSIICNRPDGEEAGQPAFAAIAAAAQARGLGAAFLPVISGQVTGTDAMRFGELVDTLPKPVLAYCRSGARSSTLWSMAENSSKAAAPSLIKPAD